MLIKTEKTLVSFLHDAIKNNLIIERDNNYHALSQYWFTVNGGYSKSIGDNLLDFIGYDLKIVKMQ